MRARRSPLARPSACSASAAAKGPTRSRCPSGGRSFARSCTGLTRARRGPRRSRPCTARRSPAPAPRRPANAAAPPTGSSSSSPPRAASAGPARSRARSTSSGSTPWPSRWRAPACRGGRLRASTARRSSGCSWTGARSSAGAPWSRATCASSSAASCCGRSRSSPAGCCHGRAWRRSSAQRSRGVRPGVSFHLPSCTCSFWICSTTCSPCSTPSMWRELQRSSWAMART
mmetsp:Transcript_46461/g.140981  ORF Transcript_46461/g.140981 Transcript_46461/m.140981 type:complete len:230 (+) Transcript_46461:486-1175(+)